MKFSRSAPTLLIVATLVVIAAISLISMGISKQMTASFEDGQFELMERIMLSKLRGAEGKASSGAEMIAAMPTVKKTFASRNREETLANLKEPFRIVNDKYGISQGQFHTPPATSFLRLHNPEKFGDDQSHFRQMVVEVNQEKAMRRGIEVTTSGVGIFGTVPMTDEADKPVGSFEMGMEFGPLLDELKKTYEFELALFIEEKILRETAKSLSGDILNDQNRVGKFIKFYATHTDMMRALVTEEEVNVTNPAHYLKENQGVSYGVLAMPIYNYAKKQIGVVAMAKNFSATRSAEGAAVVWQGVLAIVSFVLLVGVILVTIRGLLLTPLRKLNGHMASLAAGDTVSSMENTDGLCAEMKQLVGHYEQLRSNAQAGQGDVS
ncbi:MAG: hypothetical protein G8237_13835 [Magnetococcales bacterium]|nr:hypothetical protein [Magnetococcales bacterium]